MAAMMAQNHKQTLTIAALSAMIWAVLSVLGGGSVRAGGIVTNIVTNPLTGVAIDGFDPVSYFTDPDPQPGRSDFEYDWGGVPWYFASAANRDEFKRAPSVYAPQFGGYGAMSLARGYLSDGNPRIYLITAQRLYLFYSNGNRDAFLLAPSEALKGGFANWPQLAKGLLTQTAPVSAPGK